MRRCRTLLGLAVSMIALTAGAPAQARAQDYVKQKHYPVSSDEALSAARGALERQGYEVVKVIRGPDIRAIYYRRAAGVRGNEKAPIERMVIRAADRHVVLEAVPSTVAAELDRM